MNRLKIIQILVVLGITVNSISSLEQKFPSFPPVFPFFPHFWENSLTLSKQSKIDHFVFALSWPVTPIWAFNDGAPAAQNSSWVIKGLWPEVRGKERPSPMYCSENHPFNKTAISSIEVRSSIFCLINFFKYWGNRTNGNCTNCTETCIVLLNNRDLSCHAWYT